MNDKKINSEIMKNCIDGSFSNNPNVYRGNPDILPFVVFEIVWIDSDHEPRVCGEMCKN